MSFLKFFSVVVLLAVTSAEEINFRSCEENACDITQLRVDPCPQAPGGPCKIKRGRSAKIEFDFTPNFNSPTMKNEVFWESEAGDAPFLGIEEDACQSTSCPLVAGTTSTYSMSLPISRKFPIGTYPIRWIVKGESGESCCFRYSIKLTR